MEQNHLYIQRMEDHSKGYSVRVPKPAGGLVTAYFSDAAHGSKEKAEAKAIAFRDREYMKIFGVPVSSGRYVKRIQSNNNTGEVGVYKMTQKYKRKLKNGEVREDGRDYYVAAWCSEPGKIVRRKFSVSKYGEEEALRLASECRQKAVGDVLGIGVDDVKKMERKVKRAMTSKPVPSEGATVEPSAIPLPVVVGVEVMAVSSSSEACVTA